MNGEGSSYEKLQKNKLNLEFRIKNSEGWFCEEGDVSEGQFLVDADGDFVSTCADIINDINQVLRHD